MECICCGHTVETVGTHVGLIEPEHTKPTIPGWGALDNPEWPHNFQVDNVTKLPVLRNGHLVSTTTNKIIQGYRVLLEDAFSNTTADEIEPLNRVFLLQDEETEEGYRKIRVVKRDFFLELLFKSNDDVTGFRYSKDSNLVMMDNTPWRFDDRDALNYRFDAMRYTETEPPDDWNPAEEEARMRDVEIDEELQTMYDNYTIQWTPEERDLFTTMFSTRLEPFQLAHEKLMNRPVDMRRDVPLREAFVQYFCVRIHDVAPVVYDYVVEWLSHDGRYGDSRVIQTLGNLNRRSVDMLMFNMAIQEEADVIIRHLVKQGRVNSNYYLKYPFKTYHRQKTLDFVNHIASQSIDENVDRLQFEWELAGSDNTRPIIEVILNTENQNVRECLDALNSKNDLVIDIDNNEPLYFAFQDMNVEAVGWLVENGARPSDRLDYNTVKNVLVFKHSIGMSTIEKSARMLAYLFRDHRFIFMFSINVTRNQGDDPQDRALMQTLYAEAERLVFES